MEFDDAIRLFAALQREQVRYVLVGSMGMAVHGLVRATRDIDLFVDPTVRPQDRMDAAELQRRFRLEEE